MILNRRRANLLLITAAAIWGFAFVAQRLGMRHIEPFTFNAVRFLLGTLVLLPLLPRSGRRPVGTPIAGRAETIRAGVLTGLVLFTAGTLQQYGIVSTTAGKAGFITSLYVVFVPLLGLVFGQRVNRFAWTGVAMAAVGLYLLSAQGLMNLAPGDGLVLLCAVFWSVHVQMVGAYVHRVPAIRLAIGQFATAAVLSIVAAAIFDTPNWTAMKVVAMPLLYAGVFSIGIAFTLQVAGQKSARPTDAAIIMSFESVFAAIGGGLLLGERLGLRELAGCALILGGGVVAQGGPAATQAVPVAAPAAPSTESPTIL
jgi:drug/metabolite transporter (DMT)-like permease